MTPPTRITSHDPNTPIGIFDSGVGGLSIWREVTALLPAERIVYFADNANCPYGQREPSEVCAFSENIVRFLLEKKCKLIVVACNTATTMAIAHLRRTFPVPFVGIEPGVKPAALESHTGVIGILATTGTLKGRLFNETRARFASHVQIQVTEGAGLVEIVEQGRAGTPEAEALLRRYIEPMLAANIDRLVLGCTHYSFLAADIHKITQGKVELVMPNVAVAQRVKFLLTENNLLRTSDGEGDGGLMKPLPVKSADENHHLQYEFFASGESETLTKIARQIGAGDAVTWERVIMKKAIDDQFQRQADSKFKNRVSKKKNKLKSWADVRPGLLFRSIKRLILDDPCVRLPERPHFDKDDFVGATNYAERILKENSPVIDPRGKKVSLLYPDCGTGCVTTIRGRAEHLISPKGNDTQNRNKRCAEIHSEKLKTVGAIALTIANPQVIASIGNTVYYFRRFGSILHMIICDKNESVNKPLGTDLAVVTQYPVFPQDDFRNNATVVWLPPKT